MATMKKGKVITGVLDEERRFFQDNRGTLIRQYNGKSVVIKGPRVIGAFADDSAALQEGRRRFGTEAFLVKRLISGQSTNFSPLVTAFQKKK